MSIRITKRDDGFWYVDFRISHYGTFKADSRYSNFEMAAKRAEELAKGGAA